MLSRCPCVLNCIVTFVLVFQNEIFVSTKSTEENEHAVLSNSKNNCDKLFNDENENGLLNYNGKNVPENVNCIWKFDMTDEIFMEIESFYLFENDSFVIKDNKDKIIFGPYTGNQATFIIATGNGQFKAQLVTSPKKYNVKRTFSVKFSTKECKIEYKNLLLGVLSSPVYLESRSTQFFCQYTLEGVGASKKSEMSLALTIMNMTIQNSFVRILLSGDDTIYATNGSYFPQKYYGKGVITVDVIITPTNKSEHFKIMYEVVPDACSGIIDLNPTQPTSSVTFKSPDNPQNSLLTKDMTRCNWAIRSPAGTKIRSHFSILSLKSLDDQLVVSNPKPDSHPLRLSYENHHLFKEKRLISPSNELWVQFTSLDNLPGVNFKISFSFFKDGILNQDSGNLSLTELGEHNFKVTYDKVVHVVFDKLKEGTILEFYPDLLNNQPSFLTVDYKYSLQSVTSPTNELKLVVKEMIKPQNLEFYGINHGCDSTIVQENGFLDMSGTCYEKCDLVFPPKISSDDYKFKITTKHASVLVESLNSSLVYETDNLKEEKIRISKINLPVKDGVVITITRNCLLIDEEKVIKISFTTEESCERNYQISVGQSISILSPGYPKSYSLNSKCHWSVETVTHNPALYLVSFNQFNMEDNDVLKIRSVDESISLYQKESETGLSQLPRDFILKTSLEIDFESQSKKDHVLFSKFVFHVTAIECGGYKTDTKGVLTFSSINMTSDICIWSISVPSLTRYSHTSLLFQINGDNGLRVTVYDGSSIRDPVLTISDNGTGVSVSGNIIIQYKQQEPYSLLPLQVVYQAFGCNEEYMCKSGACMKMDWKCNGVNDCGDYSDEIGCKTSSSVTTTTSAPDSVTATTSTPDSVTATTSTPDSVTATTSTPDSVTAATSILQSKSTMTVPTTVTYSDEPGIITEPIEINEIYLKEVLLAGNKVSVNTLIISVFGSIFICCLLFFIFIYYTLRKYRKSKNYLWESLSTLNASYQSDKDIVSI